MWQGKACQRQEEAMHGVVRYGRARLGADCLINLFRRGLDGPARVRHGAVWLGREWRGLFWLRRVRCGRAR